MTYPLGGLSGVSPCCCPPPVPLAPCPPKPEPAPKPCPCPPRVYRNPPDVELVAGRNIDLQVDKGDTVWKYTVSSEADKVNVLPGEHIAVQRETTDDGADFTIDAVQFPVKIDGDSTDVLYGDGTPENPLGVYDFVGATASSDGKPGTVPAPAKTEREYYLRGDGTWAPIVIPEQVQSDWAEESELSPAFIRNKPDIDAKIAVETNRAKKAEAAATTEVKAGENATVTEETSADGHKIYTVNADGKPQVQADWAQEDETKVDYIRNRPDIEAMIDSAVSTERDRATEAETALRTEIGAETERATEAEATLRTEIVTETERAIAGEAAATTEVVAGNNVTVDNSVAADGHSIYTVTVNECGAAMMDAWLDEVG